MLNSFEELRQTNSKVDAGHATVMFDYGVLGRPELHQTVKMKPNCLADNFEIVKQWTQNLTNNPILVFGARNMFQPLLWHYGREYSDPVRVALHDILENYILPGAVPTLSDRCGVDRKFAEWLTGKDQMFPSTFLLPLIAYARELQ